MADVAELEVRVTDAGTAVVARNLDRLGQGFASTERKAESFSQGFSRGQARLVTFDAALNIAARTLGLLERAYGASVGAAAQQEDAIAALNAQLQAQGRFSTELSQRLQAQAEALEQVTTYSDEAIESAQTMLATFPQLADSALPRATEATLDLATAMGGDVVQAAQALGLALSNPAEGLGRLSREGIRFTQDQQRFLEQLVKTGRSGEALTLILDAIADRFGGRARAAAETFGGSLKQLGNLFDDLLEEIGNTVVKSEAVRGVFDHVKSSLITLADKTRNYVTENRELIDQKIDTFFRDWPDRLTGAAEGMGTLAANTAEMVASLKPLFAFVANHPEIALALFGAQFGPAGFVAGAAGAGLIAANRTERGHGIIDRVLDFSANLQVAAETEQVSPTAQVQRRVRENQALIARMIAEERANARSAIGAGGFTPAGAFGDFWSGTGTQTFAQPTGKPVRIPGIPSSEELGAAQKSLEGFQEAAKTRAETAGEAAERQLAAFQQQLEVEQELALTEDDRNKILIGSEQQQLALAKQIDAAERAKLQAEISVLQAKQQSKDTSAGEKDALQAQIEQLQAEADAIGVSTGKVVELKQQFALLDATIQQSHLQEALDLREQVRPAEALAKQLEHIGQLATEFPTVITPEVHDELAKKALADFQQSTDSGFDDLINATRGFGNDFSRTLAEGLAKGKLDFTEFFQSLLAEINRLVIQDLFTTPLLKWVEDSLIRPLQRGSIGGGTSPFGAAITGFAGPLVTSAFTAPPAEQPEANPLAILGLGGVQEFGNLLVKSTEPSTDASKAIKKLGEGFTQVFGQIGSELTALFTGLGNTLSNVFSSLFGGGGFDIAGFFGTILGGAIKGGISAGAGGGTAPVGYSIGGEVSYPHGGGVVAAFFHQGGMRQGDVPAILQEGELVVPRAFTAELARLLRAKPQIRRFHDGGSVGSDLIAPDRLWESLRDVSSSARTAPGTRDQASAARGGGIRQTVHLSAPITVVAFDPRTAAQMIMQQGDAIEKVMVERVGRGGRTAAAFGLRQGV